MCLCGYADVYICKCATKCTYMYIHPHIYIYACIHTCICTPRRVLLWVGVDRRGHFYLFYLSCERECVGCLLDSSSTWICIHLYTCIHIHTCIYIHVYKCTQICMYDLLYLSWERESGLFIGTCQVHMYIHTCVYTHISIYIHIHPHTCSYAYMITLFAVCVRENGLVIGTVFATTTLCTKSAFTWHQPCGNMM